jgi:hypothetical protein
MVFGRIEEDLDAGGRHAHIRRARLLLLARHGFVEKEWCAAKVKRGNPIKIPQLAGAKRFGVPGGRRCSVGHDQHD